MRAYTSGSCSRTQSSFGAVKPGSARLPVSSMSRSKPTRSSISAHCGPVRWSFQRIAGRSTFPAASRQTRPCICPDSPIPSASAPTSASALSAARTQSSGSCSDQPGRGVESGYSRSTRSSTSPVGDTASALTAVVPTSSPTSVMPAHHPVRPARASPPLRGHRRMRRSRSSRTRRPRTRSAPPPRAGARRGARTGALPQMRPRRPSRRLRARAARERTRRTPRRRRSSRPRPSSPRPSPTPRLRNHEAAAAGSSSPEISRASARLGIARSRCGSDGSTRDQRPLASQTVSRLVMRPRRCASASSCATGSPSSSSRTSAPATWRHAASSSSVEVDLVATDARVRARCVEERPLAAARDEDDARRRRHGRVADHAAAVDAALVEQAEEEVAEGIGADLAGDGRGRSEPRERARGVERAPAAAEHDLVDEAERPPRHRVDRPCERIRHEDAEAEHRAAPAMRHVDY